MNRTEARTVKRQLEGYLDYLELAKQAEEKAEELEKRYEAMAGLRCMPLSKNDSGKNSGMKPDHTSRFLEIFDEQDELLKQAEAYRAKAGRCRRFIESIDDDRAEYLRMAYLEGMQFSAIGEKFGCPASTVKSRIDLCLEQVPVNVSRFSGIL